MSGPQPAPITLSPRQHRILTQLSRRTTSEQRLVHRSQILLTMAAGANNEQAARQLGLHPQSVRKWRSRWLEAAGRLEALEAEDSTDQVVTAAITGVLSDAPRSGTPPTFTPEQLCHIMALTCERPEESDRPVTHWTPPELAAEAVKRGIVPSISPRTVGRVLKRGQAQTASGSLLAHQ
jgi:putative transposase